MKALQISRISALGFTLLLGILHIINNEIDPTWQPISEYALGDMGWLMNMAFFLLAASFCSLGLYLIFNIKTLGSKIGGWLLILASIGNLLAGIFNTDPVTTIPEQMSLSGNIHAGAAGLLGFMILATLFISYQFLNHAELKPFKFWVLVLTPIVLVLEFILIIAMVTYLSETNGLITPDTPFGILGRLVILACAIWVMVTASIFMKVSNHYQNIQLQKS